MALLPPWPETPPLQAPAPAGPTPNIGNPAQGPHASPVQAQDGDIFALLANGIALNGAKAAPDERKGIEQLDRLRSLSATHKLEEMKMRATSEVLVLGGMVALGQMVAIHAPPNAGKTLIIMYLIRKSIESALLNGQDVFYLNYDDNYQGFIDKTEIAREFGFNMIGPNEISVDEVKKSLNGLADNHAARGTVFVFDTLKKFIDVMDKKAQAAFYETLRKFVMAGGTVVTLGHVNKNRTEDGKLVQAGTQDVQDDFDAQYLADFQTDNKTTVVCFTSTKNRGTGVDNAYYTFGSVKDMPVEDDQGFPVNRYKALMRTVKEVSDETGGVQKDFLGRQASLTKNASLIAAIQEQIRAGNVQQSKIINVVNLKYGHGKRRIREVLVLHTWTSTDDYRPEYGYCWQVQPGPNNSQNYVLIA